MLEYVRNKIKNSETNDSLKLMYRKIISGTRPNKINQKI